MLVLDHFDSDLSEQMPAFGPRCFPVVPQIFLGRSARSHPPCKPQDCVYCWYRDPTPFMTMSPDVCVYVNQKHYSFVQNRGVVSLHWVPCLFRCVGAVRPTHCSKALQDLSPETSLQCMPFPAYSDFQNISQSDDKLQ